MKKLLTAQIFAIIVVFIFVHFKNLDARKDFFMDYYNLNPKYICDILSIVPNVVSKDFPIFLPESISKISECSSFILHHFRGTGGSTLWTRKIEPALAKKDDILIIDPDSGTWHIALENFIKAKKGKDIKFGSNKAI